MNELTVKLNNEGRISSIELVEIINTFRQIEKGDEYKELRHDSFTTKIKKELKTLESIGLNSLQNILESTYTNSRGKIYNCYSLNRDGMLQMLNSESPLVRYKTIEYINKLENQLKEKDTPKLPSTYKEALIELLAQVEKNEKLELENAQQKQQIGELKPKADYTDIILKSNNTVTITQIAKDYGKSGQEMNKILNKMKIQYKQSNQWLLYSKYHNCGYTKSVTNHYVDNDGNECSKLHTKWTQKGRLFLYGLLKENGIIPLIEQ